jgi:hypothetical protein
MIWIGYTLVILAGISKAIMDKINFHYSTSIFKKLNPLFWNPEVSWRNKWKNGDVNQGEKFFGSSTFLVWTTDAWHLFQMVNHFTLILGVLIVGFFIKDAWIFIINFVFLYINYTLTFEIFFKYFLNDRKRNTTSRF